MPINRKKHREQGLCTECTNPTKQFYVRCERHLEIERMRGVKKRKKRVDEGRCIRCGIPMIDTGLGGAKTKCVNCNEYKFIW